MEDKEKMANEELENLKEETQNENKTKNEIDLNKLVTLLVEKYNIDPFKNLNVKDVASDLGMNQNSANDLFRRKDFPAITFTKPKQVCWLSYILWKMERRV